MPNLPLVVECHQLAPANLDPIIPNAFEDSSLLAAVLTEIKE
jgi:hypothetical protein